MKNRKALLTLTSIFLLFPFGRFISRTFTNTGKDIVINKNGTKQITFDTSLRNFHSNKGE